MGRYSEKVITFILSIHQSKGLSRNQDDVHRQGRKGFYAMYAMYITLVNSSEYSRERKSRVDFQNNQRRMGQFHICLLITRTNMVLFTLRCTNWNGTHFTKLIACLENNYIPKNYQCIIFVYETPNISYNTSTTITREVKGIVKIMRPLASLTTWRQNKTKIRYKFKNTEDYAEVEVQE